LNQAKQANTGIKKGFYLAVAALLLAVVVIMLGSFTRLVDAGLGCPDWPGCYGHLTWPDEADEIVAANQAYPDAPVLQDKTWPEMVHRYVAGTLGLFVLALAVIAFRNRKEECYPFRLPMIMFVLVVWQAMFGMWTVTLKLWPQVVTIHLMGGVATFSLLALLAFRLNDNWRISKQPLSALRPLRPLILIGLLVVIVQVFLGGWVASNYAAVACPDFPTCQLSWIPPMNFAEGFNFTQGVGPNYLGGRLDGDARTAIHFAHRIGALVTALYLFGLVVLMLKKKQKVISGMAGLVAGLLVIQIGLGISNVLMSIPLSVAVAHNFMGALLVAVMAVIWLQTHDKLVNQDDKGKL
jgi:cytochrome c oxidase assembly protein subunit 15|tara:strand:- start:37247 stop:38302 length:1056 start_codon:yes stop_codon:yes gene_type:complete